MANLELKEYAAKKGVKHWQIAEKFGVVDSTFCRWMRHELTKEKASMFRKYVDEIAEGQR